MNQSLSHDDFVQACRTAFAFLRDYGFSESPEFACATNDYDQCFFVGKQLAIVLHLDRRDRLVECYITRIANGKPNRYAREGGHWESLGALLIRAHGLRRAAGSHQIPQVFSLADVQAALERCANDLRGVGAVLLADNVAVLKR